MSGHVVFHLIQVASEPASEFMEGLQRTLQVCCTWAKQGSSDL